MGTAAGTVELWNPATGEQIGLPVVVGAAAVTSIAFDPSGTAVRDRGPWRGHGQGVGHRRAFSNRVSALSIDQGATASAALERGGDHLLAVDDAGHGFTWPTSLMAWERRACTVAGRNLSREEWSQLITGRPYTPVCP